MRASASSTGSPRLAAPSNRPARRGSCPRSAACAVRCRGCRWSRSGAGAMRNGRMRPSGSARSRALLRSSSRRSVSPRFVRARRRGGERSGPCRRDDRGSAGKDRGEGIDAPPASPSAMERPPARPGSRRDRVRHRRRKPAQSAPPHDPRAVPGPARGARAPDRERIRRHHRDSCSRCASTKFDDGRAQLALPEALDAARVADNQRLCGLGVRA